MRIIYVNRKRWLHNMGLVRLNRACGSKEYRKVKNGRLTIPGFGIGDYAYTEYAMKNINTKN